MRSLLTFSLVFLFALQLQAQFTAEVETSLPAPNNKFRIALDYSNAPYAVANFILLAGNDDGVDGDLDADPLVYTGPANTGSPIGLYSGVGPQLQVSHDGTNYTLYQGIYKHGTLDASGTGYADTHETFTLVYEYHAASSANRWLLKTKVSRNWMNIIAGTVTQQHFYKNLNFSNSSPGNYIAMGSRNGGSFETPGFILPDETIRLNPNFIGYDHKSTSPFGTSFNSAYSVGMLNSGSIDTSSIPRSVRPNSGGAIWFVTLKSFPYFNGRFTHFGSIVNDGGRAVVNAIASNPSNVKIKRISVTNALSSTWSPVLTAQEEMPEVIRLYNDVTVDKQALNAGRLDITFPVSEGTTSSIFTSTDMVNWTTPTAPFSLLSNPPGTTATTRTVTIGYTSLKSSCYAMVGNTKYKKWPSYQMTNWASAVVNFGSKQLTTIAGSVYAGYPIGTTVNSQIRLNPDGRTGVLQYGIGPYAGIRAITNTTYTPVDPYRGDLTVTVSGLGTRVYELYFDGRTLVEKANTIAKYVNRYRLMVPGEAEFGTWQRTDSGGYYR